MGRFFVLLTVSFVGSCLTSAADGRFTCPETKPVGVKLEPIGAFAGRAATLAGDERLFTIFPGNWKYVQRVGNGYRIPKIVWGSETFDVSKERLSPNTLTITGRRLDAEALPLEFRRANTGWIDRGFFITSEFFLPSLGCWEVTGHFHGADLKIVVDLKTVQADLR